MRWYCKWQNVHHRSCPRLREKISVVIVTPSVRYDHRSGCFSDGNLVSAAYFVIGGLAVEGSIRSRHYVRPHLLVTARGLAHAFRCNDNGPPIWTCR